MRNRRNYYRILHVQPDAPDEVIRSSYRTMMQAMKMHPDLGGRHEDAVLLNEAYAVLVNPGRRASYDAELARQAGRNSETAGVAPDVARPRLDEAYCPFCRAARRGEASIAPDEVCRTCGSALFPAEQSQSDGDEQRAMERIARRSLVRFWREWPDPTEYAGTMEDLSLNGIQIRSPVCLGNGEVVRLAAGEMDAVGYLIDAREIGTDAGKRWRLGLMFLTLRFHRTRGTFVSMNV